MAGSSAHWSEAEAEADLGLPVPPGTRLRFVRRVLGKLLYPVLRRQVLVNRALLGELDVVRARLDQAERRLDRVDGDLEHHTAVIVRHEEPLDRHEFLLKALEPAIMDLLRQIDLVQDKVDLGQRQALARYQEGLAPLRADLVEIEQRLGDLERERERLEAALAARNTPDELDRTLAEIWLRVTQLDLFLTEMRRSFPGLPEPERLGAIPHGFDGLYPYFEDAFRGSMETVKARVSSYVAELGALTCGGPVLDVGSGRGELLDLLAAAGVDAYGVELLERDVEHCRSRGLDVRQEDAFAHLREIPERSLAAVTAVQFVEHLEPDELVEFVGLAARAVRPGGLLVVETQNPENLVVGASSFYLDPTHRRPVPPALLSFIVSARGFDAVEVRRLMRAEQQAGLARPKPDEPGAEPLTALVDAVNFHLFSPADYAVVGRRP